MSQKSLNLNFFSTHNFHPPLTFLQKNPQTFKLRKVNHTLGDHRSGRAWDSNHGPNETDGRHLSKKPKNLRKKLPKKKNEKFSEKKIKQKKLKETFSLTLVSALSELQG